ncbi:MAG: hypothetical protein HOP08_20125 [Cyclobacteriaceae bacterium]|nr:hypothetical protein [Cyclobacteriaceae bacterium]
MKGFYLFVFLILSVALQGQSHRPKVGLTLSGGGAKGLAHIGILKAIDSAGLKIDMVTGTSMGSIMGALYAVGYSGDEIEKIARKIDWVSMFSNKPPIDLVNMNEKKEYSNYAVEIPLERGKAKFYSGFIEAEEIWLRFGELFYPVHKIKDFSKFNIPFQCIATEAATGKAVVLSQGEIVKAVRSSMAIPSIFSAVSYQDKKLVDGGVVKNFPASNAKQMGADYIIGVNLSHGLMSSEKLQSPIDMIYQIGFYKDADGFEQEKKLCNLLIEPDLEQFSAASFGATDSIINIGNEVGRKYYPYFKRLADSIQALYPEAKPQKNRLPVLEKVIVDGFVTEGLLKSSYADFVSKLGLIAGKSYSGKEISQAARKAFSSGNFRRISFFVEPQEAEGHVLLRYEILENPPTHFKVGLHYHTYTDIAMITTLATRNLIFNRSKSYAKINWSSNFRMLLRHDQAFGKKQRWGALLSFYHERFRFPIYSYFKPQEDYRSFYSYADMKIYRLFGTTSMIGVGTSHEWLKLDPVIAPNLDLISTNDYWNSYFFFQHNSLNTKVFPHRGSFVDVQAGMIYKQNPSLSLLLNGLPVSSDTVNLGLTSYQQIKIKAGHYFPLGQRWTLISQFNSGINLNYNELSLNFYSVGGINDFIRNQIPFVGLGENEVNASSISAVMAGFQFEPFTNIVTTFRANVGVFDFIDRGNFNPNHDFISGYALSGGYRSAIGPIEISLIYSDQSKTFKGYVNLGFTF